MHIGRPAAGFLAVLALVLVADEARAAITVGSPDGWNLTVGGFTMAAPEVDGIKTFAGAGFHPQINGNNAARTTIDGADIDLRELNFTVDGSFGQVLVGRAIGLWQSKDILTDMSLLGVGGFILVLEALGGSPTRCEEGVAAADRGK